MDPKDFGNETEGNTVTGTNVGKPENYSGNLKATMKKMKVSEIIKETTYFYEYRL